MYMAISMAMVVRRLPHRGKDGFSRKGDGMMEEYVVLDRARRIFRALEYCEAGDSASEAGRKAEVSNSWILRLIKRNGGIEGAKGFILQKIREEESLQDAVNYYLDGHRIEDAAVHIGVPEKKLRSRLQLLLAYGYRDPLRITPAVAKKIDTAIEKLRSGKTIGEVAKEMNYKSLEDLLYQWRLKGDPRGFEFCRNRHIKKKKK